MDKEIRQVADYRITKDDSNNPILEGYAVVFDTECSDLFTALNGFSESIDRNAFANCSLDNVVALVNHNDDYLLGRSPKTVNLSIDNKGVAYRILLPDTTYARDLSTLIERGDIGGCSFAFSGAKSTTEKRNGIPHRTIKSIANLLDISVVKTYPAYDDTTVAKRSIEQNNITVMPEDKRKLLALRIRLMKAKYGNI